MDQTTMFFTCMSNFVPIIYTFYLNVNKKISYFMRKE